VAHADEVLALVAQPDAVAQRDVVGLNEIEEMLQLIDDDRADRLQGAIERRLTPVDVRLIGIG